ncbi:MAG: GlsB/YeaQ/YmgE family stress response membrane protein [Polyangiales bacterium]
MGLLWALVIGLIVGALAKLLMPGRDGGGVIVTMLLGVAGSFLALLIGRAMGVYDMRDEGPGIIASTLGALLILAGWRAIVARRRRIL